MVRFWWSTGIAAAGLVASTAFAAAAEQKDLSGEYVMAGKGVGENDRAYVGTCTFKLVATLYDVVLLQFGYPAHLFRQGHCHRRPALDRDRRPAQRRSLQRLCRRISRRLPRRRRRQHEGPLGARAIRRPWRGDIDAEAVDWRRRYSTAAYTALRSIERIYSRWPGPCIMNTANRSSVGSIQKKVPAMPLQKY